MTDKPFYEPGQKVEGAVYLRILVPLTGVEGLHFEVKGGGKNSFTRFWQEAVTEGEGEDAKTHFEERSEKLKHHKKFMGKKEMMHGVLPASLGCGDYCIPFEFTLPNNIPSSIQFKSKTRETPKAKVKYYIKATVKCHDHHQNMDFKQVLAIREKPEELKTDVVIKETS